MIFHGIIRKVKKVHIDESRMSLLSKRLKNTLNEGGILNVYDIDKSNEDNPLLKATYKYIPYNDGIYADFSNFKGDDEDIVIANAGRQQKMVNLGVGDTVKNKLEPDILKIDGEPIKCYNLTMLGDENTRVMVAHIYKGKPSPYPKNPSYSIIVTDVEDSKETPNYFKGESEYLEKINNVVRGCGDLMNFNPTYIIYPESSSDFNGQLMDYLKNNFFPNAECLGNENGNFAMPKNNVWGINFSALAYNGMKEIMGYSNYRKYYSKNSQTRNMFEKEYFLKQLTALFEPQIARLIPQIRKQYFLEKRSSVDLNAFYRDKQAKLLKNSTNEAKYYSLSNHGRLLSEVSSAAKEQMFNDLAALDNSFLEKLFSAGLTGIDVEDFLYLNPGISKMPIGKAKKLASKFIDNKNYVNSNFEQSKEQQTGERLVSLEDIPEIEEKYMTPKQRGKMNSFVRDPKAVVIDPKTGKKTEGKSNMDSKERKYLMDFLHGYFMTEMEKFDEAAEKFNLAFSFQVPPFGEELLLNIYRKLLSRRDFARNGVARNKEFKFGNYNNFVNSFIKGRDKDGKFFSFDMGNLAEIAEESMAIKDYSLAARKSFLNQFRLGSDSKSKINDKIEPIKERIKKSNATDEDKEKELKKSLPRFLIIDDNFSSGVSLKNAAKAIHEELGIPYSNIMALTPGDMGQPSSGNQKYEDNPIFNAEGCLNYWFKRAEKDSEDGIQNFDDLLKNYLGLNETNETDRAIIDKISSLKIDHDFSNRLRNAQFGNLTKGSTEPYVNIERSEIFPEDPDNEIEYAPNANFGKAVPSSEIEPEFNTDPSKPHITVLWLDDKRTPYEYFQNRRGENGITKSRNLAKYYAIGRSLYMDFEWVTNFGEFVMYIQNNGLPDMVSFDFDIYPQTVEPRIDINTQRKNGILYTTDGKGKQRVMVNGVGYPNNGKGCAEWLVNYCRKTGQKLPECYAQSANKNVYASLVKIYEDGYNELGVEKLSDKYPELENQTIEFDEKLANNMRNELEQSRLEYIKNNNVDTKKEFKLKDTFNTSNNFDSTSLANPGNTVQNTTVQTPRRPKINTSIPLPDPEKEEERRKLLDKLGQLRKEIALLNSKINNGSLLRDPNRDKWIRDCTEKIAEREKIQDDIYNLTVNCLQNIQQQAPVKQTPPVQQQEHLPGAPNVIFKGPARERKIYRTVDEVKEGILKASKYTIDELEAMCRNYRLPLETLNDAIETLHKYLYGNAFVYINTDIIKSSPAGIDSEEYAYFIEDCKIRKALLSKLKDKRKRKLKAA